MGTNLNGFGKLLQGVVMNLVEFMFAVTAVFGSTGIIFAWTTFAYNLELKSQEKSEEKTVRVVK